MTQKAVATQEIQEQAKSKTQELRDWLDQNIRRAERDCEVLTNSLKYSEEGFDYVHRCRYGGLTSDEREVKVAQDREKLKGLRERLELLYSARELGVDIDAIENLGVVVSRVHSHQAIFEGVFGIGPEDNRGLKFRFDMGYRTLQVKVWARKDMVESEHYREGITSFSILYGQWLSWRYPAAEKGKECELTLSLHKGPGAYLVVRDGYRGSDIR